MNRTKSDFTFDNTTAIKTESARNDRFLRFVSQFRIPEAVHISDFTGTVPETGKTVYDVNGRSFTLIEVSGRTGTVQPEKGPGFFVAMADLSGSPVTNAAMNAYMAVRVSKSVENTETMKKIVSAFEEREQLSAAFA